MNTVYLLVFLCGSLSGFLATAFFCVVALNRKEEEMHDEIVSTRETIRRNAYARGYEAAKRGEVKRS